MVHVELDNIDYLSYEITSVERKLARVQRLYPTEKILLRFLKQWIKSGGHSSLWKGLHTHLQELSADIPQSQLFANVDLISWVESKIRRIPFAQAVADNAKARRDVSSTEWKLPTSLSE
jgi:hypothetical protein